MNLRIQLTHSDMQVITRYAKGAKCFVDIGADNGGSALLAKTGAEEVYTIDIDPNRYQLHGIDMGITFIEGKSLDIAKDWDKPINVLFIDGNHHDAYKDFLAWEKFVVKGGYILFHDYLNDGGDITVKDDLQPLLTDERYEKIFIPNFPFDGTRILQVKKI